jgi:flagellar basal-body rod protein FlgC
MDFDTSMAVAASGLRAQTERMKIIAENIANANLVSAGKPLPDKSDFRSQYDPGNPNADAQGYIKLPNVDSLVEIMDMREAQRSYEADLNVMDSTKQMMAKTVDLLNK